jgi:hypothetical protein
MVTIMKTTMKAAATTTTTTRTTMADVVGGMAKTG